MSIKIRKKLNESTVSLVRRFSQQIRTAGILQEVKKRMHRERPKSKQKIKQSALIRNKKRKEYEKLKRFGRT